jgi:Flp pilus assembly protein TadB
MTITRQIGAIVALVCLVILLLIGGVAYWRHVHAEKTAARVEAAQSGATIESAKDAIGVQSNVAANEQAAADLTRSNEKEIRDAKGADQAVDPAVRDAGLASLCRRPSYHNSRRCQLRQPPAP